MPRSPQSSTASESVAEYLHRAQQAGSEERIAGLVERPGGVGDALLHAGLFVADQAVGPEVGDGYLQLVKAWFQGARDIDFERCPPKGAQFRAVEGDFRDVADSSKVIGRVTGLSAEEITDLNEQ